MAKTRKKKDSAAATPSSPVPATSSSVTATGRDVARRAYDLYLARGREDGHDVEDWLRAEHDLRGPLAATPEQDIHKGAIEGDRPGDEQIGNPNGTGIDVNGLPNDPIATAEDRLGAEADESQG